MTQNIFSRRTFLASSTAVVAGAATIATRPSPAEAQTAERTATGFNEPLTSYKPMESDFPYEVQRTEAEWREYLDNDEEAYHILREAGTETPKSTDLWLEPHDAGYMCRGCDLPMYEARWFERLQKGWVFFHNAVPQSVLFALDGPVAEYGQAGMTLDEDTVVTEVHCRRCGSHVGHHLKVSGMFLHCINGQALKLV